MDDLSFLLKEVVEQKILNSWIESLIDEADIYVSVNGRDGQSRKGVMLEGETLLGEIYHRFWDNGFAAVWRKGIDDSYGIAENNLYSIDLDEYFAICLSGEMKRRYAYG